jgi:hypothetical protein
MTLLRPSRRSFVRSLLAAPLAQRVALGAVVSIVAAETSFGEIRGSEHDGIKAFKEIISRRRSSR